MFPNPPSYGRISGIFYLSFTSKRLAVAGRGRFTTPADTSTQVWRKLLAYRQLLGPTYLCSSQLSGKYVERLHGQRGSLHSSKSMGPDRRASISMCYISCRSISAASAVLYAFTQNTRPFWGKLHAAMESEQDSLPPPRACHDRYAPTIWYGNSIVECDGRFEYLTSRRLRRAHWAE